MSEIEAKIIEIIGPREIHVRSEIIDTSRLRFGEIAARTIVSVVSPGTECAAYRGDPPLRPMKVYPRVVGYCNVAEVLACSPEIKSIRPGDRILTGQSHRSAFVCGRNRVLAKVPASLGSRDAASAYLFQLGYNALIKGAVQPGQNVAVVGLGTLGFGAAAVGNVLGTRIYAFSNQTVSAATMRVLGVRKCFAKGDSNASASITEDTGGAGIDLVISTSNLWSDWRLALSLPRIGGTVSVLGFPGRAQPLPDFNPLASEFFYDRQLKIVACGMTPDRGDEAARSDFNLQANCEMLFRWIEEGKLPAKQLVSLAVPWQEIGMVYERIIARTPGFLTAALSWE